MDIGLHYTLDDTNSILDPEILAIAKRVTPQDANEFGRVWELFGTRNAPIQTDEFEILSVSTQSQTLPLPLLVVVLIGTLTTTSQLCQLRLLTLRFSQLVTFS